MNKYNMNLVIKNPLYIGHNYDLVHEYEKEEGLVSYKIIESILGTDITIQTMDDVSELKQIIKMIEIDIKRTPV